MTTLEYHRGDERPAWEPSITVDGEAEDYSTGYSFQVTVTRGGQVAFTKTAGITGNDDGSVTVDWAVDELDLDPGRYKALLRIRRDSDDKDLSVQTTLTIL